MSLLRPQVGVHSTMKDERGRPCLAHVLPAAWRKLHPVGRLDADTSGLLLFSSDGGLTHRLLHPKFEVRWARHRRSVRVSFSPGRGGSSPVAPPVRRIPTITSALAHPFVGAHAGMVPAVVHARAQSRVLADVTRLPYSDQSILPSIGARVPAPMSPHFTATPRCNLRTLHRWNVSTWRQLRAR